MVILEAKSGKTIQGLAINAAILNHEEAQDAFKDLTLGEQETQLSAQFDRQLAALDRFYDEQKTLRQRELDRAVSSEKE
ncbi:MAG: hypothetical protein R6U85_02440, partial [Salinivirgaceae bacterium]